MQSRFMFRGLKFGLHTWDSTSGFSRLLLKSPSEDVGSHEGYAGVMLGPHAFRGTTLGVRTAPDSMNPIFWVQGPDMLGSLGLL